MFYYLKGELVHTEPSLAVIDCSGVGYAMTVSATTSSALTRLDDKKSVKLLTHLIVREDGVELFGFYTSEELRLFKMLITVSGVGPKAAISILSTASVTDLIKAIVTGNQKAISAAQGVGAKTAARVILELKDKMSQEQLSSAGSDFTVSAAPVAGASAEVNDALAALTALGYSAAQAQTALKGQDLTGMSADEIIRLALKKLF